MFLRIGLVDPLAPTAEAAAAPALENDFALLKSPLPRDPESRTEEGTDSLRCDGGWWLPGSGSL